MENMLTCKIPNTRYHKITILLTMKLLDKSNRKNVFKMFVILPPQIHVPHTNQSLLHCSICY